MIEQTKKCCHSNFTGIEFPLPISIIYIFQPFSFCGSIKSFLKGIHKHFSKNCKIGIFFENGKFPQYENRKLGKIEASLNRCGEKF